MNRTFAGIHPLPPRECDLESRRVLRALSTASRALGELKGRAGTIPNQGILIDSLVLQEALASSEIENIVTTQDELFQQVLFPVTLHSPEAKEVASYRDALLLGYKHLVKSEGLISNNTLIEMYQRLKRRADGFRATPGTVLVSDKTGMVVYTPPQDKRDIENAMTELERFINDDDLCELDPLIKMALIHHQFESIHPFADGNGRIGRILNVLYLTKTKLLEIPILYLSRYIIRTKGVYYERLQTVRDNNEWEGWLEYMLLGVAETAELTITIIERIKVLMQETKYKLRSEAPKIYSQDLLNNIFRHPYTRIKYVIEELKISRPTATKYLDHLVDMDILLRKTAGRDNYYVNHRLCKLFLDVRSL